MFNFELEPGTYVVAVSGGVDSMVLLHGMHNQFINQPLKTKHKLVVAHFDHGIRPDSAEDRRFVQAYSRKTGLPFVYQTAELGPKTSEAEARQARYEWLHKVKKKVGARAIITAHHLDDALETAFLQLLRGSGRLGLSALKSTDIVKRPLLKFTKQDLINYAKINDLSWREDSSNADQRYLRNKIRHHYLPKMNNQQRLRWLELVENATAINQEIDTILNLQLHLQPAVDQLNRRWFNSQSHNIALEVMAHWLRRHGIRNFDRKLLDSIVVAAKTLAPHSRINLNKDSFLDIKGAVLALSHSER